MKQTQMPVTDRRDDINKAFGRMYFAIYSVDLISGKYLEVSTLDIFREHIPFVEDNQLLFDMVVKYYVSDGYKDSMRRFLNMETLQERLSEQNAVSNEFFGTTQGWCRAHLVAEKRDEDGKVERFIYVTQEINEEVKSEQERIAELKRAYSHVDAANQAKTDFLFRMSHDVRTPLNVIMGFNDILMNQPDLTDKAYDCAKKIRASGDLLVSLLDGILDIAKFESGSGSLTQSLFSMRKLVSDLEVVMSSYAESKEQSFEVKIGELPHSLYIGDKSFINRVLFNMLNNAVKFTDIGGAVSLEISGSPSKTGERFDDIVFRIKDNGIGIPYEDQEHIFDMPHMKTGDIVGQSPKGLNLPLAKKYAVKANGDLTLKSEPGRGSEFVLTLPLKYGKSDVGADDTEEKKDILSGLHILIVEDNELNMEIVTELLEMSGAVCEQASSGAEAVEDVEKLCGDMYDLILMDVRMPGMDGYEATRRIRAMEDERKSHVPIAALSANSFEEDIENSRIAGMDAHLSKPLDMRLLRETVKELLKK